MIYLPYSLLVQVNYITCSEILRISAQILKRHTLMLSSAFTDTWRVYTCVCLSVFLTSHCAKHPFNPRASSETTQHSSGFTNRIRSLCERSLWFLFPLFAVHCQPSTNSIMCKWSILLTFYSWQKVSSTVLRLTENRYGGQHELYVP